MAPDRWLVVLLRIHFPLHPVAQLHEVRSGVIDMLADPDLIAEFELNPDARALLEGMIASVEEGVKLLIDERLPDPRQAVLLHLPPTGAFAPPRPRDNRNHRRLNRVLALQDRLEDFAGRRAFQRLDCRSPIRHCLAPTARPHPPA